MKLVSCASANFGICASTEDDPSSVIAKYLPNDQYWIGGTCVSCPAGWTALNGRCYQRFGGVLAYNASQADCQSKNSALAILNTQAKFDLAKSLANGGELMVIWNWMWIFFSNNSKLTFFLYFKNSSVLKLLLQTYLLTMTDRPVFFSMLNCYF